MTRHGPFHYSGSPRDRIRRPHRYYCRAKTPCCHPDALRCLRTSVPPAFLFSLSYLLQVPERRATLQARVLRARPDGHPRQYLTRWNSEGLPGSWGVLPMPLPCSRDPGRAVLPCHFGSPVLPPLNRRRGPQRYGHFRGWFTRLQHLLPTLPSFGFPTLARLASGGWQTLTGWDSNPLDSSGEFQAGSPACLFQRPRLNLAPLPSALCSMASNREAPALCPWTL